MNLLDQVRDSLRKRRCSIRKEQACGNWSERYLFFHGKRHPGEMGAKEIPLFLSHPAKEGNVAAGTQSQAPNAPVCATRPIGEAAGDGVAMSVKTVFYGPAKVLPGAIMMKTGPFPDQAPKRGRTGKEAEQR